MMKREFRTLLTVFLFASAMGFLEAAVVDYLRLLFCPGGFGFPFEKFMGPEVLRVEILREVSTLVMLLAVAALAGKSFKDRLAYFLFAFAIWDLFYYAGLKAILNWPDSWTTLDLLFLIPWAWVGPVLAPVIASLTMILLAYALLDSREVPRRRDWVLLFAGGALELFTFLVDYGRLVLGGGHFQLLLTAPTSDTFLKVFSSFVPGPYEWPLFWAGEALILAGVLGYWRRSRAGSGKEDPARSQRSETR